MQPEMHGWVAAMHGSVAAGREMHDLNAGPEMHDLAAGPETHDLAAGPETHDLAAGWVADARVEWAGTCEGAQ